MATRKSIDVWQIVESGWTKLEATAIEPTAQKSARLSNDKVYVKLFHHLDSQEFQIVNPLKKRGKFWK
jgi:hypothetical protein